MQITLYQNSKPLNHSSRTFTAPVTITGFLREGCDIFDPEIEIEYNAALLSYNYALIPDYGNRYYYFREAPTIEGKKIILHLTADSLYNWLNVIMKSHCIAERSSSNFELMLEDSAVSAVAGYELFSRSLPYTFRPDQGIYVLIVAGG
jgi:hypothetical protein